MKSLFTLLFCCLFLGAQCQYAIDEVSMHNRFALTLYKACVDKKANLFISPYSIRTVLMATAEGARGETRSQFDSLLILPDAVKAKNLLTAISNQDDSFYSKANLEVANAIWVNKEVPIKESFLDVLLKEYNSDYFPFDPANQLGVSGDIDRWVSGKTHGNITTMPAPEAGVAFAFLNAVYFRDKWANQFKKKKTKLKNFYTLRGDKRPVAFMQTSVSFDYFENDDIQALTLPYRSKFSMVVLLPRTPNGLDFLERNIDENYLSEIFLRSTVHPTVVSLPKFEIRSELEVTEKLSGHGFKKLFNDEPDLSGISEKVNLQLGQVIHKTFITIDEQETEAAAVTEEIVIVGYGGGDPPPPPSPKIFKADHPFLFLIIDKTTGAIVFAGRFTEP